MTKKHFTLIAQTLAACKDGSRYPDDAWEQAKYCQWENTVKQFAERLAKENPKFDCAKFYQACNYEVK